MTRKPLTDLLFGFMLPTGRVSRRGYWLGMALASLALAMLAAGWDADLINLPVAGAGALVVMFLVSRMIDRRIMDFGQAPFDFRWKRTLIWGAGFLLYLAAIMVALDRGHVALAAVLIFAGFPVALLLGLIFAVRVGLRKGDPERNRFGAGGSTLPGSEDRLRGFRAD